jgi:hypothetical protein
MPQNWNNVLQYVKANFGTKTSALEITDDEFFEYFQNHSLPYFSQIIPNRAWTIIKKSDSVNLPNNHNNYTYKLKIPDDIELIDINEVYFSNTLGQIMNSGTYFINPIDTVMMNTYNDMHEHLMTVNDYHFLKPDYIRFSQDIISEIVIAELNIEHSSLKTIDSDMYHKLFKPMCLMHAIELVINNRNKFTNVTTPFGEIDLNISNLESRLQELRQKIDEIIEGLPHRKYVEFF